MSKDPRWTDMTVEAISYRRQMDYLNPGAADMAWRYMQAWRDVDFLLSSPSAPLPTREHQPGDHHEYEMACRVCGQPGTVQLTLVPEHVSPVSPRWSISTTETLDDDMASHGEALQAAIEMLDRSSSTGEPTDG